MYPEDIEAERRSLLGKYFVVFHDMYKVQKYVQIFWQGEKGLHRVILRVTLP